MKIYKNNILVGINYLKYYNILLVIKIKKNEIVHIVLHVDFRCAVN